MRHAFIGLPQSAIEIKAAVKEIVWVSENARWVLDGRIHGAENLLPYPNAEEPALSQWLASIARLGAVDSRHLESMAQRFLLPRSEAARKLGAERIGALLSRGHWRSERFG